MNLVMIDIFFGSMFVVNRWLIWVGVSYVIVLSIWRVVVRRWMVGFGVFLEIFSWILVGSLVGIW